MIFEKKQTKTKPVVDNMFQPKSKCQFCKQNKLAKFSNFIFKFETKYAIEKQSQCLEEPPDFFESKVGEGLRFVDLTFQKVSFLTQTAFFFKIGLLKLVKINVIIISML